MEIGESLKMSVKMLLNNRLRSILTMLGIVIGNASVILTIGLGQGARKLASEQFEILGPNTLFIVPGSRGTQNTTFDLPKTLVLEDARAIAEQVPSVRAVAPQLQNQQVFAYRNKNLQSLVVGTTPHFSEVRNFAVERGRFLTDIDLKRNATVVVLGSDVAERLFDRRDPIGETIRIKNVAFQIVGVMERKGTALGTNQDDRAFVPITTMSSRIVGENSPFGIRLTFISVAAKDASSIQTAKFQMTNLLRRRHQLSGKDDFTIDSQQDVLQIVGVITGALTFLLAAIASISLLVGGIGITNIMLVSVAERTSEIGLRKALGAAPQDILIQFTIEAVLLAALGGLFGTGLGATGLLVVGVATPLNPGISPIAIALATSISGGIGLFFGVFPARQAARLDPIVALRRA